MYDKTNYVKTIHQIERSQNISDTVRDLRQKTTL